MSPATLAHRARASAPALHPAVATLFVLDGTVFGTWAARIPDISSAVHATPGTLGAALFCISLGALAGMRLTGALCARYGTGLVAVVAAALACVALVLPGLASSLTWLGAALLLFGLATGAVNVAANSLGVLLTQRLDRPVMSQLHAGFSLGGLAGALAGGLLSGLLGVPAHFVLTALVGLTVLAGVAPALLAADSEKTAAAQEPEPAAAPGVSTAALVVLGAIAGCTAFGEGALSDWGALHLRENLHAAPALAAAGYAGFSLAMAAARFAGYRLIMRFGDTRLLVGGTLLAAVGVLAVALGPTLPVALAGFVLVGLGLANVFPLAVGRAGLLGGPRGVALASTVGYSGLLGGPPLIGLLADSVGLPAALTSIAALAATAAVLSAAAGAELPSSTTVAASLRVRLAPYAHSTGTVARNRAAALTDLWATRRI